MLVFKLDSEAAIMGSRISKTYVLMHMYLQNALFSRLECSSLITHPFLSPLRYS